MPIDYAKYPPTWWSEIVPRIRLRARNCCERCGVRNWTYGWRDPRGKFRPGLPPQQAPPALLLSVPAKPPARRKADRPDSALKLVRIVLTVAHLDHNEENWQVTDDRLALLCQRCHLNLDRPDNQARRKYGKGYRYTTLRLNL